MELLSWGITVAVAIGLVTLAFNTLQVVSSSEEFWIARCWFVLAALVLTVRFVYWGIVTSRNLTVRVVVCLIAFGIVGASAIEAIRYVNRKNARWTVQQLGSQNPSEQAAVRESPPFVPVSVESVSVEPGLAEVETTKTDRYTGEVANLYRSNADDPNNNLVDTDVAFAKFRRNDASQEPFVDIRAKMEFFNTTGELLYTVDKAYWWRKEEDHAGNTSLRVGHTDKMIVALVGGGGKVFPYSGDYISAPRVGIYPRTEFVLETRARPLEGKKFAVRVELIGTRGGARTLYQTYDYYLITEPEPSFSFKGKSKGDES